MGVDTIFAYVRVPVSHRLWVYCTYNRISMYFQFDSLRYLFYMLGNLLVVGLQNFLTFSWIPTKNLKSCPNHEPKDIDSSSTSFLSKLIKCSKVKGSVRLGGFLTTSLSSWVEVGGLVRSPNVSGNPPHLLQNL